MSDEKRCIYCIHWRCKIVSATLDEITKDPVDYCALERPLVPCKFYEREPGADDDLGEQA